jgi:hypothetical protein
MAKGWDEQGVKRRLEPGVGQTFPALCEDVLAAEWPLATG